MKTSLVKSLAIVMLFLPGCKPQNSGSASLTLREYNSELTTSAGTYSFFAVRSENMIVAKMLAKNNAEIVYIRGINNHREVSSEWEEVQVMLGPKTVGPEEKLTISCTVQTDTAISLMVSTCDRDIIEKGRGLLKNVVEEMDQIDARDAK